MNEQSTYDVAIIGGGPLDIRQASTPLEQASKQPCLNKVCRVDKWQHPTLSIITQLFPRYQELSLV